MIYTTKQPIGTLFCLILFRTVITRSGALCHVFYVVPQLSLRYPTHIPPITHIIKGVAYRWVMGGIRKGMGRKKKKDMTKKLHSRTPTRVCKGLSWGTKSGSSTGVNCIQVYSHFKSFGFRIMTLSQYILQIIIKHNFS